MALKLWRAMKSMDLPLAMGIQISTGRCLGRGTHVISRKPVAAVLDGRRNLVVLALVGEGLLVEALEKHLHLLLEQLAVGRGVEQRRAERLDLARVVAASHAHDDAAVGDDVGHGVVLGQAHRMPHGQRC